MLSGLLRPPLSSCARVAWLCSPPHVQMTISGATSGIGSGTSSACVTTTVTRTQPDAGLTRHAVVLLPLQVPHLRWHRHSPQPGPPRRRQAVCRVRGEPLCARQKRGTHSNCVGWCCTCQTCRFLNPLLYSLAESNPEVFYDVTVGSNYCGACGS